jgi:hypothetical protein
VLVEQDVLELEVAVDARLAVDIGDGADELGEDALDTVGVEGAVAEQVVVELVAGAVLEDQPDELLGDDDLVETGNVGVDELAVVMDLAGEVGVVLLGRLEDDARAVAELVRGEVDLAEAAFANQTAEGVVADGLEVGGGEFTGVGGG